MKTFPPARNMLTLRISIEKSDPEIWRRFQVTDTMTLDDLHDTIQIVMGWTDSHLHRFSIAGKRYSKILPDIVEIDGQDEIDEDDVLIGDVIKKKGQKFVYIYDYGDNWRHNLVVEEIGEPLPGQYYPVCLDGERACPPEDCSGIWGYYRMLESLRDPDHEEHASYLEWLGGSFDPDHFDLEARNAVLERFDEYVSGWDYDGEDWEP